MQRDSQRLALRGRQRVEPIEERRTELMETGERQLDLGFHARRPPNPETRGLTGAVMQERRLADAGLPAQDEHSALAPPDIVEEEVERCPLIGASEQRG